jgi:hypothetical protein
VFFAHDQDLVGTHDDRRLGHIDAELSGRQVHRRDASQARIAPPHLVYPAAALVM